MKETYRPRALIPPWLRDGWIALQQKLADRWIALERKLAERDAEEHEHSSMDRGLIPPRLRDGWIALERKLAVRGTEDHEHSSMDLAVGFAGLTLVLTAGLLVYAMVH